MWNEGIKVVLEIRELFVECAQLQDQELRTSSFALLGAASSVERKAPQLDIARPAIILNRATRR
jgi:hypothetical protein